MTDDAVQQAQDEAAAAVAAAKKAQQDAEAAVKRAEEAAAQAQATAKAERTPVPVQGSVEPVPVVNSAPVVGTPPEAAGPLGEDAVQKIAAGYAFTGAALEMGALVNGDARADVQVRIPLGMLNRHGLVAGATGTGKTKTLQVLAEQLSAAGVPVFAADIKGDLSGIASPGAQSPKLLDRTRSIGQHWQAAASPTEYFALGGLGHGIPIRATVSGFGPLLLSKVLGLNATQTPKDVPDDILAQLGSRVQHQLRAHTPNDAKALRATVSTYPSSDYDLGEVLTSLAIGEAIVTAMNEKGAPSPVAWTRLRAPQGSMDPTPEAQIQATISASLLLPKYGTAIDRDSAREMLARKMDAAAAVVEAAREAEEQAKVAKEAATEQAKSQRAAQVEEHRILRQTASRQTTKRTMTTRQQKSPLEQALGSPVAKSIINEVVRGIFGTRRRR